MKCALHQDQDAIAVCQSCGNALCSNCRITLAGVAYCQSCLDAGRIRMTSLRSEEFEEQLPTPQGNVTITTRRNILIGIIGLILIAIFIHAQWLFPFYYYLPSGALNYGAFVPGTVGAVLVAAGIGLSALAWYEFRTYFNFRWAFYIALFTLLTPWWGILAELSIYSGQVIVQIPPYSYPQPGPLAFVFNILVLVSSTFFGILMVLWAVALLNIRKISRASKLTLGASIIYLTLAHMMLLMVPVSLQGIMYYPTLMPLYGFYSTIPSIILEIGVILNAIFFYRLVASLKPY